jgi:hypothetical protein
MANEMEQTIIANKSNIVVSRQNTSLKNL